MIEDWDRPDPIIDEASLPRAVSPHPKALWLFSISKFFERFAHHGARSILVYYLFEKAGDAALTDTRFTYEILVASLVLVQIPGGLLIDLGLRPKLAIIWGGFALGVGYFICAFDNQAADLIGLILVGIGTATFVPASFTRLAASYRGRKKYLDAGFSYYFAAIYGGSVSSGLLVVGIASGFIHWRQGLMICGIAMMLGHVYILAIHKIFAERPLPASVENMTGKPLSKMKNSDRFGIFLFVIHALFWTVYFSRQTDMFNWLEVNFDGGEVGRFANMAAGIITAVVFFAGGALLTLRPGNVMRRMGQGLIIAIFALDLLLGAVLLSGNFAGIHSSLFAIALILVLLAFAEMMILPPLYTLLLGKKRRFQNTLVGMLSAAAYLPLLGLYFFPEGILPETGKAMLLIICSVTITLAGIWLIRQKKTSA